MPKRYTPKEFGLAPAPPPTPTKRSGPHSAPCGGACVLKPEVAHYYCTCKNEDCPVCHARERFMYAEPRT